MLHNENCQEDRAKAVSLSVTATYTAKNPNRTEWGGDNVTEYVFNVIYLIILYRIVKEIK